MTSERSWTYWIRWQSAGGTEGPRVGPFNQRRDAVRRIEADIARFASNLEHGTGQAGSWEWDATHQVATLFRDDLDLELGRFIIEGEPDDAPLPSSL